MVQWYDETLYEPTFKRRHKNHTSVKALLLAIMAWYHRTMAHRTYTHWILPVGMVCTGVVLGIGVYILADNLGSSSYTHERDPAVEGTVGEHGEVLAVKPVEPIWPTPLDTEEYDSRLLMLTDYTPPAPVVATTTRADGSVATTTTVVSDLVHATGTNVTVQGERWPTAAPYPYGDAILPFKRILAFYGNFLSTRMGILGEYEPDEVLKKLQDVKAAWEKADPTTPVLPAIEYIAIVAQGSAGADGMYRAVMSDDEIDKGYEMAQQAEGILIIDLQVGRSTIQRELPQFRSYLERPDVHLALDPEFSMKTGKPPGTVVGSYDASDINFVINYLAAIVNEKHLPPKVLIVHRFTPDMVTRATSIKPRPEVQVVMNMDGWGSQARKRGTYSRVIIPEPVQFTGIKLFYKNDLKPPSTGLLTPEEVLALDPKPIYIQYQ